MFEPILIGIDCGSSRMKALAIDAKSGTTLATRGAPMPLQRSAEGATNVDTAAFASRLIEILSGVASELGPRSSQVIGMACTGHGAGLYCLDGAGRPLALGTGSTDSRAAALAATVTAASGRELYADVGSLPWPGQPLMIAGHLLRSAPDQIESARHILFAKDFATWLLTGEMSTDESDASTAGMLRLGDGTWSTLALEAAGLPASWVDRMPPLRRPGDLAGKLLPNIAAKLGLPPGTPVAVGAIDLVAAMAGADALHQGDASLVLGTWSVNALVGPQREPLPDVQTVMRTPLADGRIYLENSPSSMSNFEWFKLCLEFPTPKDAFDAAFRAPLGAHGVRFLPFVNGLADPVGASAGFLGVRSAHGRDDLARAVVDAIAAVHCRHVRRLKRQGLPVKRALALGGGGAETRLCALLATMLGEPLHVAVDSEPGARGAVMFAAVAAGYKSWPDALEHFKTSTSPISGSAEMATQASDFADQFERLLEHLRPAFLELTHPGAAGGRA